MGDDLTAMLARQQIRERVQRSERPGARPHLARHDLARRLRRIADRLEG